MLKQMFSEARYVMLQVNNLQEEFYGLVGMFANFSSNTIKKALENRKSYGLTANIGAKKENQ